MPTHPVTKRSNIARALLRRYRVVLAVDRTGSAAACRHGATSRVSIGGWRAAAKFGVAVSLRGFQVSSSRLPDAVGLLCETQRAKTGTWITVSSADPLNLAGSSRQSRKL